MFKHDVTYTDFDGNERTETVYFYLSGPEMVDLQMSYPGGFGEYLQSVSNSQNGLEAWKALDKIVRVAYGEKSPDGRFFVKERDGHKLVDDFVQSPLYEELMVQLMTSKELVESFTKGVMPEKTMKRLTGNDLQAIAASAL